MVTRSSPRRCHRSRWFSAQARTRTSTWPGRGDGSGTVSSAMTSGPPCAWNLAARTLTSSSSSGASSTTTPRASNCGTTGRDRRPRRWSSASAAHGAGRPRRDIVLGARRRASARSARSDRRAGGAGPAARRRAPPAARSRTRGDSRGRPPPWPASSSPAVGGSAVAHVGHFAQHVAHGVGGGAGLHAGLHGERSAAAPEVEAGAHAVGVALLLAQRQVQPAHELAAEHGVPQDQRVVVGGGSRDADLADAQLRLRRAGPRHQDGTPGRSGAGVAACEIGWRRRRRAAPAGPARPRRAGARDRARWRRRPPG